MNPALPPFNDFSPPDDSQALGVSHADDLANLRAALAEQEALLTELVEEILSLRPYLEQSEEPFHDDSPRAE